MTSIPPRIRMAGPDDVPIIARHRALMFREMGVLPDELHEDFLTATRAVLPDLIESGAYVAWLVEGNGPQGVVAGVGLYLRTILPRPGLAGFAAESIVDREGLVVNAFTEADHRRRGLARAVMERLIEWAQTQRLSRVVLHASDQGRPLYEQLGFVASNEMRLMGGEPPPR